MITVNYRGRLGNMLFEYALGRVLAEDLGYELIARSIDGFPATNDRVTGSRIESSLILQEQVIDLERVKAAKGKLGVTLNGWFQRYEYYRPHKQRIRGWFNRGWVPTGPGPSDVVVHVRRPQGPIDNLFRYTVEDKKITINGQGNITLDDTVRGHLARMGVTGHVNAQTDLVPFEWYEKILDKMSNVGKVFICTDMPADPFLEYFAKYKPVILQGSLLGDFNFMRSARRIVACMSTYSWWAGFLSDAEEVYLPTVRYGSWGNPDDVNLTVDDDPRFSCVEAVREGHLF